MKMLVLTLVLENSGMIRTTKLGRTRTCVIEGPGLSMAEQWLASQREIWEARTDRLEAFAMLEQQEETNNGSPDR